MELTLNDTLIRGQWVAVWISMLFTALSAIVALTDSDSRKKRLLRDVQILDGLKDYGDPFYIHILQERIKREFESVSKPQLFGLRAKIFFALYYVTLTCWTIAAFASEQFTLCAVNLTGLLIISAGIIVASINLKQTVRIKQKPKRPAY